MLAKKCDRCGELYMLKEANIRNQKINGLMLIRRSFNNQSYTNCGYIDLCPSCLDSLNLWLNMQFEGVFALNKNGIDIVEDHSAET